MRLNYLQTGGHDPNVLHKFTEMEYEARFRDTTTNSTNRFINRPSNQIGKNTLLKILNIFHFLF